MKKILIVLLTVGLVAMLVTPAFAVYYFDKANIPTHGIVTGGATNEAPVVKAKWELPDDGDSGHDPATHPNDTHVDAGTQVAINPSADKIVTVYTVVRDPNGAGDIANVFVTVKNPDGSVKYFNLIAQKVTDPTEIENAKKEAVACKLITQTQSDELNTQIALKEAYMYKVTFAMNYCQAAGEYTVEVWATDMSGSNSAVFSNKFMWLATKVFELDFSSLEFGPMKPCVNNIISGDTDMGTPSKPTIKNEGNVSLNLKVHSTVMKGAATGYEIKDFDVTFLTLDKTYVASEWVVLPTLPLCNKAAISFSVHPPIGTPGDDYAGTTTIKIDP